MNAKLIEQKQLVERYTFGRLSPPEAKFFERIVRDSPELAEQMGLPQALQRVMHLLDETGTEWRDKGPARWQSAWVVGALAVLALVTLLAAISGWSGRNEWATRYARLNSSVSQGLLPAPSRSSVFRLHPSRPGEQVRTYAIGTRASPTFAELHLDVSYVKATLFKVLIKRSDGTYWGRLDNQLRDTNGDLRLAVNTAAFAAGNYEVEIDEVNLRGEGVPVGRVGLQVDPG
jgi:hypothetical protein